MQQAQSLGFQRTIDTAYPGDVPARAVEACNKAAFNRVTDEYGEWPIEGKLTEGQVTVVWSVPEDGKMMEITMKGKLEGNLITGTAKLGDVGEGPLSARRTGDAGVR